MVKGGRGVIQLTVEDMDVGKLRYIWVAVGCLFLLITYPVKPQRRHYIIKVGFARDG